MNPSLFSSEILFRFFIFFTVFTSTAVSFRSKIFYSDHCNTYVPEAMPTDRMFTSFTFLEPITSHYTGGQIIFDQEPPLQWSISFASTPNLFKTNVDDTYKIQAELSFMSSNIYYRPSNYSRVSWKEHRPVVFKLDGYWSLSTNKLCMVGSALWFKKEHMLLKINAVLKLKVSRFTNLNNSLVSGILKSLDPPNDLYYFDPISMLGFPQLDEFSYNYTLVSDEECDDPKTTLQDSVISMTYLDICSIFRDRFTTYKLEYPSNCKNCSLFGQDNDYLPTFVSLYAIQCSRKDKNIRFLVEFLDRRITPYDQPFQPDISLIGEGTWSGTKDELCIIACPILNQSDPLGSARVGDCSFRLTLWFPAVWSITKTHNTEGQIWTTKFQDNLGSSRMAKFQSFDHSTQVLGTKYEYTQMEKLKQICPKKKRVRDKFIGEGYHSGYYSLGITVKHKNMVSSGSAVPTFMESRGLNNKAIVNQTIRFEISFMLNISSTSRSGISSLNLSSTVDRRVRISAEGVYDDETGQICMIGCRSLIENSSFDCEILVKIQFPQRNRGSIKGNIESLREKSDVLFFEKLDIFSVTLTKTEARELIWRIDLEIIMVLISGTLMCVFIGRQLFHLKKRPEMVNFISVLMMLILTLGHMVPLVLNFEAIFSHTRNQQNVLIGNDNGLLKGNEVIVRIVTMVAFILQFRLLQLTWMAKKNRWIHEIRTLVTCLLMYIIGGSAIFLVSSKNNSIWGDLRAYAGLTLDGFLLPQLILNIFQISKGNALSHSFYTGTTFVRLLPHAYDLYRGHKYSSHQFDRLYIYANPRADFYSPSWDIVIVCGGLVLAVIVFLQQCFGGRCMFPKRFQEHVEYDMVPVTSNET